MWPGRAKKLVAIFLPSLVGFLLLLGLSCSELTGPVDNSPRNYSWSVERIEIDNADWARANDVSWSDGKTWLALSVPLVHESAILLRTSNEWTTTSFHENRGGPVSGRVSFHAIQSFTDGQVFFGGMTHYLPGASNEDSSLVVRYSPGDTWTKYAFSGNAILDIAGSSPADVWAVGALGTLYHFDGTAWTAESTDVQLRAGSDFTPYFDNVVIDTDNVPMILVRLYPTGPTLIKYYIYRRESTGWVVRDSATSETIAPSWGTYGLYQTNDRTIYSTGKGVFRWTGTGWENILSNGEEYYQLYGTERSNVFVNSYGAFGGKVYHLNGVDWQVLSRLFNPNISYWRGYATRTEVFICAITVPDFDGLFAHGKISR